MTIFSRIKNKYINGSDEFANPDVEARVDVVFPINSLTSNPILIGRTGVKFTLSHPVGVSFTDSSDKNWEFLAEAPFIFDPLSIYRQLVNSKSFNVLVKYNKGLGDLENIWNEHFNPIYKLSAFLIALVTVVNKL